MREIYPNKRLMKKKIHSVVKPPPTYMTIFPTNLNCINDKNYEKILMKNKKSKIFYCDGSCVPNPGPGGTGFYSPNFVIKSKIFVVDHDTTINYCELMGVDLVLSTVTRFTKFCEKKKIDCDIKNINIITDSMFAMNVDTAVNPKRK